MKNIFFAVLLCWTFNVSAAATLDIPDASKILWEMNSNGLLWFRNLNEFNSNFAGCCYNYVLDTTTAQGRIFYAMLIAKMSERKGITLGFPSEVASGSAPQVLTQMAKHDHFGE